LDVTEAPYRQVLLDTGPLVAIFCENDQHHRLCTDTLKLVAPPFLTTWPVLTEAAWILRSERRALGLLYNPRGLFTIVSQNDEDLLSFRTTLHRFRDISPQLADISLLHVAEVHSLNTVFTLDQRDFTVYRVKRRRLHLLPDEFSEKQSSVHP
jgi:predicted nucleic acid-binding protein